MCDLLNHNSPVQQMMIVQQISLAIKDRQKFTPDEQFIRCEITSDKYYTRNFYVGPLDWGGVEQRDNDKYHRIDVIVVFSKSCTHYRVWPDRFRSMPVE